MSNDLLVVNNWKEKELELINYEIPKIKEFIGKHKDDFDFNGWVVFASLYKNKTQKRISEVGQQLTKQKDKYEYILSIYPHLTDIIKRKFILFNPLEKKSVVYKEGLVTTYTPVYSTYKYKDENGEEKIKKVINGYGENTKLVEIGRRKAIVIFSRIIIREQIISFIKQAPLEKIFKIIKIGEDSYGYGFNAIEKKEELLDKFVNMFIKTHPDGCNFETYIDNWASKLLNEKIGGI